MAVLVLDAEPEPAVTPSAAIPSAAQAAAAEMRAVPAAVMVPLQAAISVRAPVAVAHWVLRPCLRAWRQGRDLRCARLAHCPTREPATAYPRLRARTAPGHCR